MSSRFACSSASFIIRWISFSFRISSVLSLYVDMTLTTSWCLSRSGIISCSIWWTPVGNSTMSWPVTAFFVVRASRRPDPVFSKTLKSFARMESSCCSEYPLISKNEAFTFWIFNFRSIRRSGSGFWFIIVISCCWSSFMVSICSCIERSAFFRSLMSRNVAWIRGPSGRLRIVRVSSTSKAEPSKRFTMHSTSWPIPCLADVIILLKKSLDNVPSACFSGTRE